MKKLMMLSMKLLTPIQRIYYKKGVSYSVIFRSKTDSFFVIFIAIAFFVMGAVTILPPLIDKNASITVVMVMTSIFIISVVFLLWTIFSIKYVFYENHLLVKGGPMRRKIPYQSITKIVPTDDVFSGYRILSSKNALELFYKTGRQKSVKISPKNQKGFINELKKRCSDVEIQGSLYSSN